MSHGYKPIPVLTDERQRSARSDDLDYWMRMKELSVFQEPTNYSSVAFVPTDPYHIAATASNRATVIDTTIGEPVSVQSRFKSNVFGVTFRKDGRLMGMGSQDGYVHFIDVQARNVPSRHSIRVFQAHTSEVRALAFTAAVSKCATAGDDGALKLWDLSLSDETEPSWAAPRAHADRIRALAAGAIEHMLVTGAYNHAIKVWDTRRGAEAIASFDHSSPVERLLIHPNSRMLVSAGGNIVRFWDIRGGTTRPLATLDHHTRTVTSICLSTQSRYLLSAGLDRRVHTYRIDRGDFKLVHTLNVAAPVFALDVAPNDECMAFGMNNLLCIYRRHPPEALNAAGADSKSVLIGDGEATRRAAASRVVYHKERAQEAQKLYVTTSNRHLEQLQLGRLDKLMRGYNYRKVIEQLFTNKQLTAQKPHLVVSTLEQLRHVQALPAALSGRQGKELHAIVEFLARNLFCPSYATTLNAVAETVFTLYAGEKLSNSEKSALRALNTNLADEIHGQLSVMRCSGVVDTLLGQWKEQRRKAAATANGGGADTGGFGDLLITPKLFTLRDK